MVTPEEFVLAVAEPLLMRRARTDAERLGKKACRHETLERLLSVLIAKEHGAAVTASLLIKRCKACGRCKGMPPPI